MYKLTTLFLSALLLVSTGCDYKNFHETAEFSSETTESLTDITRVDVDVDSANIVIKPTQTETSRVEVDVDYWGREPDFDAWIDGTTLKVELDCHPSCDGEVVLEVPIDVSVDADTGSGNIAVSSIEGNISASTGSGNISIRSEGGNLDLETGSGNITGTNLASEACDADTGSGNIKLSFDTIPTNVDLGTGSGNVTLTVPYGSYDVELDTGSGNTNIEGLIDDPSAPNSIRADTGSGNITVQGS
ncbi:MAG: DUF4097 domain-containing protein [Proteobacteria bacterium]|nr:DUF4097 domain-containing protein [Pseudomonadota bacterium]